MSPYHRRLDWLMWFAAMGSPRESPWAVHLVAKLLEGDPDVLAGFFAWDPFAGRAAAARARVELYRYHRSWPGARPRCVERTRVGSLAAVAASRATTMLCKSSSGARRSWRDEE